MNEYDVFNIKSKCTDKDIFFNAYLQELSNKVTTMFEFENLPESVDENFFKLMLVLTGQCALYNVKEWQTTKGIENWNGEKWVAVRGERSGEPNVYYIPRGYVIANPAIGSDTITDTATNPDITIFYLTPFDECTMQGRGLSGLIMRTAHKLADIDISIRTAVKNSRIVAFWECDNDTQKKRLDESLTKMRNGEDVFAVKTGYESTMKINPYLSGANLPETIRELVELRQYILANFYHALGINSNYNLKRAQISNKEVETNDDILIVNTYEILSQLKRGCEDFNAKTGMAISVDYSPAWKQLREQQTPTEDTDNTEPETDTESEGETNERTDNEKDT